MDAVAHTFLSSLLPGMAGSPSGEQPNPLVGFLPIVLVLLIFYFLIIRPQQRRQKQHQAMLSDLAKGDRILTNGGIYATVLSVKDDMIVATIADGVKVEIARSAVAGKIAKK